MKSSPTKQRNVRQSKETQRRSRVTKQLMDDAFRYTVSGVAKVNRNKAMAALNPDDIDKMLTRVSRSTERCDSSSSTDCSRTVSWKRVG